jgi:4-amino-4-deoxy-L-arabinose transferase-like glycosyltransferase
MPARATRALVGLQLAALLVLGVLTVARAHVWAEIDERPHYDYIEKVVEDHRIPRPTDLVSWEVQAITVRSWPHRSPVGPETMGLAGRSYEAIQPPLYYLVAAPAFLALGDHRVKVFAVRAFDLLLAALAVLLLWKLAQAVRAGPPAFALAAAVLLWPGVIVREITIGNSPLELVLTTAFLLVLWRAASASGWRPLVAAAVLLGLGLLTKLTLLCLVPLFLVVLARRVRSRRGALTALAVAVLPLLVLAPWLIANDVRYGGPVTVDITGNAGISVATAGPALGARLSALGGLYVRLVQGPLPQEWLHQYNVKWVHHTCWILVLGLVALALFALLARARDPRVWFLAAPFLGGLLLTTVVYLATGNDAFLMRYLYPTLPPLALAAALALPRRLPVAAVFTVLALALWVDMAGAFYFTDIGRQLGI